MSLTRLTDWAERHSSTLTYTIIAIGMAGGACAIIAVI